MTGYPDKPAVDMLFAYFSQKFLFSYPKLFGYLILKSPFRMSVQWSGGNSVRKLFDAMVGPCRIVGGIMCSKGEGYSVISFGGITCNKAGDKIV